MPEKLLFKRPTLAFGLIAITTAVFGILIAHLSITLIGRAKPDKRTIALSPAMNEEITAINEELRQNIEENSRADMTLRPSEQKYSLIYDRALSQSPFQKNPMVRKSTKPLSSSPH